jgi:hypothetical protein
MHSFHFLLVVLIITGATASVVEVCDEINITLEQEALTVCGK